jgi:isopenicillin-N N-acyltransferase like protein
MATGLRLIEISGTPRERGRQYGEAARDQITIAIDYYRGLFERSSGLSWSQAQDIVRHWIPTIDEYLPGIIDEIRGIGEGAGRAFEEILALNARGELSRGAEYLAPADGCTSFAITDEASGDGHVYCGQNWDYRSEVADTVVFLRVHQPPKPTIIMYAEAGQIARHGANSAGIALNANGLGVDPHSLRGFTRRTGAPVPGLFVLRRVLGSADMFDALKAVAASSPRFSANLLITHREGEAIDLENTPDRYHWMYPTDGRLVHGNHFMAFIPEQISSTYRLQAVDSLYRVRRVERVLKRSHAATSSDAMVDVITTALRDHFGYPNSVCDHADDRDNPADRTHTLVSSVVDLTSGEYRVALGPPCDTDYQTLPWNLYDPQARVLARRPLVASGLPQ